MTIKNTRDKNKKNPTLTTLTSKSWKQNGQKHIFDVNVLRAKQQSSGFYAVLLQKYFATKTNFVQIRVVDDIIFIELFIRQ